MDGAPAPAAVDGGGARRQLARWVAALTVTALVLALDQASKAIVRAEIVPGERVEVIGPLSFAHVHNRGVAFGFLSGGGAVVLVVVLLALALLIAYFVRNADRRLLWLPTGLVLGGALGNLVDRLHQGYVTDFIRLPRWPAFNVADIAITVGVVVLVLVVELGGRGRAAAD